MNGLARTLTTYALEQNLTWPYVVHPNFEYHAQTLLEHGAFEVVVFAPFVKHEARSEWEAFSIETRHKMVHDAHIARYGNLDHLKDPTGATFPPFISKHTKEGLIPAPEREVYLPFWHFSPPLYVEAALNNDLMGLPAGHSMHALIELYNETCTSMVTPYTTVGASFSKEMHDQMHSKVRGSQSDFPHSFFGHPVYEDMSGSPDARMVGIIGAAASWDVSMRNLLNRANRGVDPIIAVVKNSFGQEYTYSIEGPDAIYLGEGDKHDPRFDSMLMHGDLVVTKDKERFKNTKDNCFYWLVCVGLPVPCFCVRLALLR